jgi:hypothetical protein
MIPRLQFARTPLSFGSRARIRGSALTLLAIVIAGCGGDPAVTPPPQRDPATLYWALTLNVRAATMSTVAPYDTLRIAATPRTISGSPIADLPAPTYTSLDLDRVLVDSTGLVRVTGSGDQILVLATLEVDNILHADTLVLNVTDESSPPTLASFTIHPDVGDSAKTAVSATATVLPRAYTVDGTPIPDVAVYFASSDPTTAKINRTTGFVEGQRAGSVTFYATAVAYGVSKTDTLPYLIGYPVFIQMQVLPHLNENNQTIGVFSPNRMTVGAGAIVFFQSADAPPTDITFDDPTNVAEDTLHCPFAVQFCGSGNIEPFALEAGDETGLSAVRARRFPVVGTYNFHSTLFGSSGTITVADGHTP